MIKPFDDLMPLTDKQKAVLTAIHSYWEKHQYYPTQRELAEQFKVSLAAIQNTIAQLRKKEYLERVEDRGRRNMRLTHKAGIILGVTGELNTGGK